LILVGSVAIVATSLPMVPPSMVVGIVLLVLAATYWAARPRGSHGDSW
jgi:hypothetical protein